MIVERDSHEPAMRKPMEDGITKLATLLVQRAAADMNAQGSSWTLESILEFLREKLACKTCKGYGSYREWVAQDETENIRCDSCRGTGLKGMK